MHRFLFLFACLLGLQPVFAQQGPKKPLDHSVYDQWQSVANPRISPNGKYVLFQVKPQQGQARLARSIRRNRLAAGHGQHRGRDFGVGAPAGCES